MAKQVIVEFDDGDQQILEALMGATGQRRSVLLRWALRYYAMSGPWCAGKRERIEVVGGFPPQEVGPNFQGVA